VRCVQKSWNFRFFHSNWRHLKGDGLNRKSCLYNLIPGLKKKAIFLQKLIKKKDYEWKRTSFHNPFIFYKNF
jgi:hypothetical protein